MKDAITEEGKWKTLSSEYLFERPWLTVRRDSVLIPNGQVNDEFYVLEYPDWVNIIAIPSCSILTSRPYLLANHTSRSQSRVKPSLSSSKLLSVSL